MGEHCVARPQLRCLSVPLAFTMKPVLLAPDKRTCKANEWRLEARYWTQDGRIQGSIKICKALIETFKDVMKI